MRTARSLLLAVLTSAAFLPAGAVAHAPAPDQVLTVGVDIDAGWLWASGSDDGCSVSQAHDEGLAFVYSDSEGPKLLEARPGGVLEITGCGRVTEVSALPRTTTRTRVRGDGEWLVGPHFTKGGVYVGKPAKGSLWEGQGSSYCDWFAHRSLAAFDESFLPNMKDGPLKVTRRMQVIETSGDCTWKRVR